jgi:hypothetical protein
MSKSPGKSSYGPLQLAGLAHKAAANCHRERKTGHRANEKGSAKTERMSSFAYYFGQSEAGCFWGVRLPAKLGGNEWNYQ